MNIYRISQDLCFLNQLGITIETGERMKLQLALIKLTEVSKCQQVLYWGKIQGIQKNYYIALVLEYKGRYQFPHKRFYWSSNNFVFNQLPQLTTYYANHIDKFRGPFTGDPNKVLIQVPKQQGNQSKQVAAKDDQDSDDQAKKVKSVQKNLIQLDRLAYVVNAIQNDCQIVPMGTFRMNLKHQLRHNNQFTGLSVSKAAQIFSYQHFRAPQNQQVKKILNNPSSIFRYDFLDPIQSDQPKGMWSVHSDVYGTSFTIRNLMWQGYMAYHQANTNIFGGVYIGDGVKTSQLCFLLN